MKVRELFEAVLRSEPFTYGKEQFAELPSPNPDNIESAYKIGGVAFNNSKGMGATPMGQNVVYEGFVAFIHPLVFLKLATQADRSDDVPRLKRYMEGGAPIATPFLEFKINPEFEDGAELEVKITGHEGRARAGAYGLISGNEPFPVEFFPRGGLKARDLSEEFFKQFRKNMMQCQGGGYFLPGNKIGKIFWMGKSI